MSPRARNIDARLHGVLLVDKPAAHTSHDVVARVRRAAGYVRCGHAGTLDPMATGVLPVLLGDATRISEQLMNHDKEYRFTLRFGQTTDTMDAEGQTLEERPVPEMSGDRIRELMATFMGPQQQTAPMYSAVKIDGQPLHRAARRGQEVERPLRPVLIHDFELEDWTPPFLTARVHCSKGTYVRVLAHDLGQAAGCGAHVTALRRIRSGEFRVERALPLDAVLALTPDQLSAHLIPLREALASLTAVEITSEQAHGVLCGQDLRDLVVADAPAVDAPVVDAPVVDPVGAAVEDESAAVAAPIVLTDSLGRALALAVRQGTNWHPVRVFPGSFEKTTCNSPSFHQNPVTGG